MRIIIVGAGFLGKTFERKGHLVWGRNEFKPETDLNRLDEFDVVINCIGKSNTRWCEENFEGAFYANALITRALSGYCHLKNKKFVHISTGCLYDRSDYENKETDFIVAHCNYTATKWAGEKFCRPGDLILRPRLFFGTEESPNNLLCKLPRFSEYIDDVPNSYSSTDVVADAAIALIYAGQTGIFNVSCDGIATTRELASWIGLDGPGISADDLRNNENLYLVNNIMSLSKLKNFYKPPELKDEVLRCHEKIQSNSTKNI